MSAPTVVIAGLATFPVTAALLVMANRAWCWLRPTGQHRNAGMDALADQVALGDPGAFAWCPACTRTTYHALPGNGTRCCWTCRTTTEGEQ